MRPLGRIVRLEGMREAALMPKINFSRAVLEPCPPALATSTVRRLTWSDLGTPRRALGLVRRLRGPSRMRLAGDEAHRHTPRTCPPGVRDGVRGGA
jgi:hypothetical protein